MKVIKSNNELMQAYGKDRNKIYSKIKSLTGQNSSQRPLKLQTPVGTFWGDDILEGFAADAEFLGRHRGEPEIYDNEFYRLCKLEYAYIFDLKSSEEIKIPPMTLKRFEEILFSIKKGKACDIYQLTAEHLQNCGSRAKLSVLQLINSIIEDIHHLSCSQIKFGIGTSIHKGKRKPKHKASSYRRITVSPIIGSILDRYIDPVTEGIFRPKQNTDQLGYTKNISYIMASEYHWVESHQFPLWIRIF